MIIQYPFQYEIPITATFQDHLDRDPPSTAPGVDFAAPLGTPVLAGISGLVNRSRWYEKGGRGIWLQMFTGDIEVYYCHLQSAHALRYEAVEAGRILATSGNTGANTTGPHLHLSVKQTGEYVDPLPLLKPPEGKPPDDEEEENMSIKWTHSVTPPGYVRMENIAGQIHVEGLLPDPPEPVEGLAATIRQRGFAHLQVPLNPNASLLKYARFHGLGAPLTPEYQIQHNGDTFVCQAYAAGIALCPAGHWNDVEMIGW